MRMKLTILLTGLMLIPVTCSVQDYADVNLAFNKTARQSSTSSGYGAGNAVNGLLTDFTHTNSPGTKWWTVDLGRQFEIGRIEIYNRPGYYRRLAAISVLIGNGSNIPDPSLVNSSWTNISYQGAPYGPVGIVTLTPCISARHVAVFSSLSENVNASLNLVEVEIYSSRTDYTQTVGVGTYQNSTYTHATQPHVGPSQYAVDGNFSSFSASLYLQNDWWRIDLPMTVLFSYAVVYVNKGVGCARAPICSDRLKNVYFVTRRFFGPTPPNRVGNNTWKVCNSSVEALGDDYTIRCNSESEYLTPLTRQFSIMSFGGDGIALREVLMFGYETPELANLNGSVDVQSYTYLTISFDQWNRSMPGGAPPTDYRVLISGSITNKTINHNSSIYIQRVSGVQFVGLTSGENYNVNISCRIQRVPCTGSPYVFQVESKRCKAPSPPRNIVLSAVPAFHRGRCMWHYTASWEAPASPNCDTVFYNYTLNGQLNATKVNETSATFYLDGDQSFNFIMWAGNKNGLSNPMSYSNTSSQIAPQFSPNDVTLVAESSTAVRLSWLPPQYPGGNITEYMYQCQEGEWKNLPATIRTELIESFPVYTNITCKIKAKNSVGESAAATTSTRTLCGAPSPPRNIVLTAVLASHDGRKMWHYTAIWEAPTSLNCDTVFYNYTLNGQLNATKVNETSATFYLDGYQSLNFIMWAGNKNGLSNHISYSNRSSQIAPQFSPKEVTLVAESSTAVRLSWQPPQYPGGNITEYLYRCQKGQWKSLPATLRTKLIGSFPANTNITCKIKAKNSVGESVAATKYTRTSCGDPIFINNISFTEDYNSSTNTRQITISDSQEILPKCASLEPLKFRLDEGEFHTERVFANLPALTIYNVTAQATNNAGNNSIKDFSITTGELKPAAPKIVSSRPANSSCVAVHWEKPSTRNGNITKYEFRCTKTNLTQSPWISTHLSPFLVHCNYSAGDMVMCEVRVYTSIGPGPLNRTGIEVACIKPSPPKFNVSSHPEDVDGTERLTISVDLKTTQSNCQHLAYYNITITDNETSDITHFASLDGGMLNFTNFDANTQYDIEVFAVNNKMLNSSAMTSYRTVEIAPQSEPENVVLTTETNCVEITASKPRKSNGIIKSYQITCRQPNVVKNITVVVSSENKDGIGELCGFRSGALVQCSVTAANSAGSSPVKNKSRSTQPKIQEWPEDGLTGSKTVPVKIKSIELEDAEPSTYVILIEKQVGGTRKKRAAATRCEIDSVKFGYNEALKVGRPCYAIAELTAEKVGKQIVFNVGDGKMYGSFLNKELINGVRYNLRIALKVYREGTEEPEIIVIDSPIEVQRQDIPVAEIAGGVTGVFAAAVICTIIYIMWRRNKNNSKKEETDRQTDHNIKNPPNLEMAETGKSRTDGMSAGKTLADKRPAIPLPKGPSKDGSEDDDDYEDTYNNLTGVRLESEAVPIEKLEWYKNTNTDLIREQYKMLEKLPKPIMELALLPENKGKCRYRGLYPSDRHRVVLKRESGSDYINASHILGYKKGKMYIAAQGPIKNTVNDFWFMIWQEKTSVILMVTRAVENSKAKCEQYWPLDVGYKARFGDIQVTTTSVQNWPDFAVSHITVDKSGESRNLLHFNYLSWPDHGVPDNIGSFVGFYEKIQNETVHMTTPILIHCSAGVGRTGTYIALEYLLNQAKEERMVDMFSCVKKMRSRRPCMIQTVDQYVFLHEVLYESIATKNFHCTPSELSSKLDKHLQMTDSTLDMVTVEYKHIEKRVNALTLKYSTAKLDKNVNKNRFSEILPSEAYIIFLQNGTDGNYINAVLVDSYRLKNNWIATQLPLSNTIVDFWQLIVENDIKIIVQLEPTPTPFYPRKDLTSLPVDRRTILRGSSTDVEHIKVVNLEIQVAEENPKSVSVLLAKSWDHGSSKLPHPSLLIELQGELERLQQLTGSGKICVTCLDGSTKCGLLISAVNTLEKLKVAQEVDIFNPTMMARQRRPQFVPTMEQYKLLYQVMKEYAGSFSEYANLM